MTIAITDRIASLDLVRGVAVMGILTMNIIGFGMIDAAYFNPSAQGGAEGANLAVYLVNFILFDGKMRGLFSFLFGASMLLVIDRATAKAERPARVHYRRMFWLLVFGLVHLYLIWWGDILTHYAIVGMVAYAARNQPVSKLVAMGVILIAVHLVMMLGLPFTAWSAGQALADPQQATQARATLAGLNEAFGIPTPTQVADQTALLSRGSYAAIASVRIDDMLWVPLASLAFLGFETLAYMFFGMAALRSDMLTGAWRRRDYGRWAAIGFAIGIPAYAAIAFYLIDRQFDLFSVLQGVMVLTVPVRPLMIVGWACLILFCLQSGGPLTARIVAVGRMAFTNYLLTSLICTTIFYGYGLGLFGQLARWELYLVVIAIWAGMLLWSKPWLDRFAYGPLEWLWRSLSRGSVQPLRRLA